MNMPPDYVAAAENAVQVARKWLAEHPEDRNIADVWKLPGKCPLWRLGLSSFQAGWAWEKARQDGACSG